MTGTDSNSASGDVAIVGMACLFPGADGPEAFWRNICAKTDQIGQPGADWGAERYLNGIGPTRITTAAGGYLGDLYRFDPTELGVMPSSVDGSEPDQFLALKAARDALADAGCLDGYDHAKTGIVLGHSTYLHRGNANVVQHGVVVDQFVSLLRELIPDAPDAALARLRAALVEQLPPFNSDIAPGLVPNVMTGRIANRLDLRGPNYLIDAACASSLIAVQTAVEELRAGRSDLMLAGGVNASIPAEVYMVFTQLGALSRRAKVRPFDASADGTLLGEGLGIVALKRLDDAVAAGDRIYAVVKSVRQASDGKGSGLLAPRLEGEVLAIRRAFGDTDFSPDSVGLVEAHGTGIPLGDRTEIQALREVFGNRLADCPRVALGAVKSMIGHCIPAAGMAGLIKTAMALHYKTLPPTLCEDVQPGLGVEATPFYLNTETRPWIQPLGKPRRAAINAFGFGGINSHAILEEATEPEAAASRPAHLAAELIVFAADDVGALSAELAKLQTALAGPLAETPLSAIAAGAVARHGPKGRARLAIVAASVPDLADKLDKARERLDAGRGAFQVRSGIYAGDRKPEGKVAFVFPGEGAQYQGMLSDVLTAFPEARRWFDFWDGLYGEERPVRPSECVFPPPTTLSKETSSRLERELFTLEVGSESVFIASQALLAVVARLGLKPDALLGHSSGEHAALRAAGVFGGDGWQQLEQQIRELNRLYRNMDAAGELITGALLTVGAVPRERTLGLADGETVHLALDNCHQQTVLFGAREKLADIAATLGREGALCAFLPFDRPYHTPLFAPVAEMVERIYGGMEFRAPKLPIYSCVTAAPMPSSPHEIRKLAALQWQSRVRFTETVQQMYADGFRTFVEIGPSANLTGFIENILQGKDFLAVPLDSRRRSSLIQLLHAVGRIWVSGAALDIGAVLSDRRIAPASLDSSEALRSRPRKFANTLPFLRIPEDERAAISAALRPAMNVDTASAGVRGGGVHQAQPESPATPSGPFDAAPGDLAVPAEGLPPRSGTDVLSGHFALMQQFLDAQTRIMTAALGQWPDGATQPRFPFVHRIVSQDELRLEAECDVDIEVDEFVRQHVLYAAEVSELDPSLTALPVVPLAVSMEMLAEVASALAGGLVPVRLEQVRTHNWVALDEGRRTLVLEARSLSRSDGETRVLASLSDASGLPLVEAEVILAEAPPAAPAEQAAPLTAPRPPVWSDADLYTTGMFHGPLFHSIAGLQGWDEGGLDAVLADTPLQGFFGAGTWPKLLINPVLLDAIGHVTAFWIAQGLGTDFSSFPSRIERIELFEADREDTAGSLISGRLGFETGEGGRRFLTGDFSCIGPEGRLLFRATGWRDRFFEVPHRFYSARFAPRDGSYGDDFSGLFHSLPEGALVWGVPAFPKGFLDDAGGIWRRVLASTVLSGEERQQWKALPGQQRRRDEWLIGRVALKEAARAWVERMYGLRLFPADLVVRVTEGGKPYIAADGLDRLGDLPEVSLAHVDGEAVAVAAPPGVPVGIDLERVGRIVTPDLLAGGFSEIEKSTLFGNGSDPVRVLQAWCAKEAAAKCLGAGLNGRPKSFVVSALDGKGNAQVSAGSGTFEVALAADGTSTLAVAWLAALHA